MYTDVSEAELERYLGEAVEPDDFDDFWRTTLSHSREIGGEVRRQKVATPLATIDTYDVTFPGFEGEPIRAWLRLPKNADEPLPAVVEYVGYGGGRGHVLENLLFSTAGYAHLIMDTRGQGSTWSIGETPDDHAASPQAPGVMTRGIRDPETYYYRRLFTDAVLAVDAMKTFPEVDPSLVAVTGGSQGGGMSLAVAALELDVLALAPRVPFLCDFHHAVTVTDSFPYAEITQYLGTHRDEDDLVFQTLSYFDGINFAKRAKAPANFVIALMDDTVPPSTAYAAYNNYAGPKELIVRRYNGHSGGGPFDDAEALTFFAGCRDAR